MYTVIIITIITIAITAIIIVIIITGKQAPCARCDEKCST